MAVFSHDTRVETLETREIKEKRGLYEHVRGRNYLERITQSNGDTLYLVYFAGSDPFSFDIEAEARAFFGQVTA